MSEQWNPLDFKSSLVAPKHLTDVVSWQGHIPFAMALVEMMRPRTFVELGTHKGDSYCAFCQTVVELDLPTRCFAVDCWEGDEHAGSDADLYRGDGSEIYQQLRDYHDPLYSNFSSLIRDFFENAVSRFADGEIDLLHIDGLHTYEAVKSDYETWLPKMSERGVMLFHDLSVRENNFGVWQLWDELKDRYPSFSFSHCNGLGVLLIGAEQPKSLQAMCQAGSEQKAAWVNFFETLADRVNLQWTLADERRKHADELGHRRLHVSQLTAAQEQLAANIESLQHHIQQQQQQNAELRQKNTELQQQHVDLHQQLRSRDAMIFALRRHPFPYWLRRGLTKCFSLVSRRAS